MYVALAIGIALGAVVGVLAALRPSSSGRTGWAAAAIYGGLGAAAGGAVSLMFVARPEAPALQAIAQWPRLTDASDDQAAVRVDQPVAVFFYRDDCGPCGELAPTMKALAERFDRQAAFYAVDAQASPRLAEAYDVPATPTVVLYQRGKPSRRWSSVEDPQVFARQFEQTLLAGESDNDMKGRPMPEQPNAITFKGNPLTLVGQEIQVGQDAPKFEAIEPDLSPFDLQDLLGKKIIVISSVPSLDTSVCSLQTKRFNEEAHKLADDVEIVTISMDLPFAQKRWCGAEDVHSVTVVSDHRDASFGQRYGMLIKELRLLARGVLVIDKSGKITYRQIVKEMTDEPDYDAALEAIGKAK